MIKNNFIVSMLLLGALPVSSFAENSPWDNRPATKRQIQSVIEYLGSDHLEGRSPGTRGGELAEEYMRSVFKLLDFEPYGEDYFQEFTLAGYLTRELRIEASGTELRTGEDVVGTYTGDSDAFELSGGAVFAGYGIDSEGWDWDDYKGASVKDRVVIVRVNEPGRGGTQGEDGSPDTEEDRSLFEGPALTYYGRWTYKIEEAARRGALAILLVHTDETAGYGWHVVRNSWSGEELFLPSTVEDSLVFRGWIREERLRGILDRADISLDDLNRASESRSFEPVDLGFDIAIVGISDRRSFTTRNVVGCIGAHGQSSDKPAVLLSAHIDHLGRNEVLEGDCIFNGAIDNGSAVASMVITAKILKERQHRLAYPVIVLACEAEESGLLGSRYFAEHIDPENVLCNINFESTPVWGPARSIMAVGARYSSLEDILKEILEDRGLGYSYFSLSEQGFFYRSDQFSFARRGIPSIWISAGEDFTDGTNHLGNFFKGGAYHTVDDEYDPGWELESTMQTIEAAVRLVEYVNTDRPSIEWKGRMTFPVER